MRTRKTTAVAAAAVAAAVVLGGATTAAAVEPSKALLQEDSVAAEGIRDTDAPRAVRVGAASFTLPVTVITDEPADLVEVGLVFGQQALVGYGFSDTAEPDRPALYKAPVELYAEDLVAWGPHTWSIAASDDDGQTLVGLDTYPTEVKAHSLLGLRTERRDGVLRVIGSARAYHSVLDRYVAWSDQVVSVQRWTGTAWVQTTGARTDARGNFTTFGGQVPTGTPLRLVLKDAPAIWGAVSATSSAA
ncbi:hypothetical protein [uncultured Pseudokineococcus sp.]|uniref:hypothetical protein n=1 Tax=uncultured Pseudokineococcus sp. TaxID=1642928 RepID=UPI00262C2C52|nr:hypothetical protein [uncultured Pseudokineococcus sp.]